MTAKETTMKKLINTSKILALLAVVMIAQSCHNLLDEGPEDKSFAGETDYTQSENMILHLLGVYAEFYARGWEDYPLLSVRGDDVDAGGLGDQQDFAEMDKFNYNKDFWMYNSVWQNFYRDIYIGETAREQLELFRQYAPNPAVADQYIAEIKVLKAFMLLHLSRTWGDIYIPTSSDRGALLVAEVSTKDEVMQYISDEMDAVLPFLPNMRPNERTDIPGGVTRYTALAIKAMANLELKNYQAVADATSQIITSNKFALESDFYQLFKYPGKLSDENLLEFQYSDFGQGSGFSTSYNYAFFGPENWTPAVTGAGSGWGFFEPSVKYIKFMLDRGETIRLETSVIFTDRGIDAIKADPAYATLPAWISNTTRDGDRFNNFNRAKFSSGKHYLPSVQLTPGRTAYGQSKNFICIRYAEILLMHAEALTLGATGSGLTADQAVNLVRARANMSPLSGVTHAQVMDEKYAELAMEWGVRFADMVRLERYDDLSYDGRSFSQADIFLPYPQLQVDQLPGLKSK